MAASCTSDVMQRTTAILSKGIVPSEAFYKGNHAVALQALTKAALAKLNKEPATLAHSVISDDDEAKKKFLI